MGIKESLIKHNLLPDLISSMINNILFLNQLGDVIDI